MVDIENLDYIYIYICKNTLNVQEEFLVHNRTDKEMLSWGGSVIHLTGYTVS